MNVEYSIYISIRQRMPYLQTCSDRRVITQFENWSPPGLSELTPNIFYIELTYLGSDASNYLNQIADM